MIKLLNGAIKMHETSGFSNPSQDGIWLAENLNIQQPKTCLDVGCGTGVASLCAKHLYPHIQLTGIDINKKAIEIAKKNSELNNFNINWLHSDIANIPVTNKFDIVFSNPPFHRSDKGFTSKKNNTAFATTKDGVINWIQKMLDLTVTGGKIYLIHHKQNEGLIHSFSTKYQVKIADIKTSKTKPAKRILVSILKS